MPKFEQPRRKDRSSKPCVDCGRCANLGSSEPDGLPRCGYHSLDPDQVARRKGRNLERQQERRRQATLVRMAEARGLLPPPEKRGAGDRPTKEQFERLKVLAAERGVSVEELVEHEGPTAAGPEAKQAARAPFVVLEEGEHLSSPATRLRVLERLTRGLAEGRIAPSTATAIERNVRVAQRENAAGGAPPVRVLFHTVTSPDDAEAVRQGEYGPTDARELH